MNREFRWFPLGGNGGLFNIATPKKKFNANTLTFGGKYPYVIRSGVNNGIKGYITEDPQYLNDGNTISFGQDTATMFYQKEPYFTGDKIKVFSLKERELNENLGLYFITVMRKAFSAFSWGSSSFNEKVLNKVMIPLPVTSTGSIDYTYMEERISELEEERMSELEEERINELKNYLQVAGLNDYTLNAEEQDAIKRFDKGLVKFRQFKLGGKDGLFEIQKGKRLIKTDMRQGKTNYIGAISENNGIRQKISAKPLHQGNCITVNYNGSVGEAFYQTEPFWASDDVNVLYLREHKLNRNLALYLITHIKKKGLLFSYQNKWNVERMKSTSIELPVTNTGEIDFYFITSYINATQKLVIKDVIDWKDMIIDITKNVIRN